MFSVYVLCHPCLDVPFPQWLAFPTRHPVYVFCLINQRHLCDRQHYKKQKKQRVCMIQVMVFTLSSIRKPPSQASNARPIRKSQVAVLYCNCNACNMYHCMFFRPLTFLQVTNNVSNYYKKSYVLYPEAPKPSKQRKANSQGCRKIRSLMYCIRKPPSKQRKANSQGCRTAVCVNRILKKYKILHIHT